MLMAVLMGKASSVRMTTIAYTFGIALCIFRRQNFSAVRRFLKGSVGVVWMLLKSILTEDHIKYMPHIRMVQENGNMDK